MVEGGREYFVAPATLIVPGVLHGSRGPLYYPPDEISKNVDAWNGKPLLLDHPVNAPSAESEGVWEKQGLGKIKNARVSGGKLQADLWFDAELTAKHSPEVLNAVKRGHKIELSTGLGTRNEPALDNSHFNGTRYTHVARDYQPDHLAILPDKQGACSLPDGCGVNNSRGRLGRFVDWLTNNTVIKCGDTGRFLPKGAGTGKGPVHAAAKEGHSGKKEEPELEEPMAKPATENLEFASDEERKAAFAALTANEASKRAVAATKAAQKANSVAAHNAAAKAHNDAAEEEKKKEEEEDEEVAENHRKFAAFHTAAAKRVSNAERAKNLHILTSNCKCDDDRAAFNSLSDAALARLAKNAKACNEEEEEEEEEDEEEEKPPFIKNKRVGVKEWLKMAPPEGRAAWNRMMRKEREERERIINALVANVHSDERKERLLNKYNGMQTDELEDILESMPTTNRRGGAFDDDTDILPSYLGAGGHGGISHNVDNASDDVLIPLTIDDLES